MGSSVYTQACCRKAFPGDSGSKESTCNTGDQGSILGLERFPGERNSYPLRILAWEIHGQRSLVDCSPQGHRARHSLLTKQQHIAEKYFSCYWIKREMSDQNSQPQRSNISTKEGFPSDSNGKESACNTEDLGLISGSGRSPGEENGNPLQYSRLENSMDRGAWCCRPQGCKQSETTE